MATIKDIANKLGISPSTVSKGLNGAHDISDEMRQLVLDTAIELGYASKKIKSRKNLNLCVLINEMDYLSPDEFGYDIILGFKQAAASSPWNIDVIKVDNNLMHSESYDTFIIKNKYHGAFLLGFNMHNPWINQLKNTIIPTVTIDTHIPFNNKVGTIESDSFEGISQAINHLVSLGHRNIAFLNGDKNSQISKTRTEAFEASLRANNIPVNEDFIKYGYYVLDSAREYVHIFMDQNATAIMCASDLIASNVINELNRMGLFVPNDVSVIGFDDIPIASKLTPKLTTIRQDRKNIGKSAYILLDSLINDVSISRMTLRAEFIKRESTGKARQQLA
ncbi:MAG: LacI family transcriptional regulator [Lachnospiraceae bacterium]|nr:LacI family transcriptional regulator [Lachnospiraceae bacterium]